ncbi:ATP-dependent DNA helicase Q-like 5 [Rhododendron vialii]|uniref:ATP-dependent DNA helicase Q-like 5 n=1 Tax=Rhododendron vialii TaxID=182163 RepID=UPI00265FEDF1|nr:ATP-dependent DNA helicase Q-like 5 [Rhododendron vialii]
MDSGSDSDGSHVSATPPRDLRPPPPPSSLNARINLSTIFTHSHPTPTPNPNPNPNPKPKSKKPKRSSKPAKPPSKPTPKPSQPEPPPPTPIPVPNLSALPFQIRRLSNENPDNSTGNNVPAGGLYLSKFASFSKIRRPTSLDVKSIVNDSTPASGSVPQPGGTEVKGEGGGAGSAVKVVRRHSNLIGGSSFTALAVKKPRGGNEGNFVRLNINGYGKSKFKFKGRRKGYSPAGGRRSFRGYKRKSTGTGGIGNKGACGEDGLVFEMSQVGKRDRLEVDEELIGEAVLGVRNEPSDENLLKLLKLTHGYESFRDGQLEAIKMVLSGKSTMLVLPTGAGKSLCYQLPAVVLPGIVLVVSPLVALMIDQLKQLPPMIEGGLICSSQTPEEMSETLRLLQEGTIKVLFVSPERFLNVEFMSIFSVTPVISLLVVDEAHCVSEWSHNFRPSYMRLKASLLRTKLNVQCILAMTATATTKTLDDVMCALEIPQTNLIKSAHLRDNLVLSVSLSRNRMKDLMTLLKSSPFVDIKSIIIYCKFQSETDLISKYLCDNNISAMSYHGGIPYKDRSRVQELFCSNKIRVVVATVAFGMGLDKRDVGAVIHCTLPESLEEYVQEIGRAGRDGRLSYCHLLFDDNLYLKLRSLTYSEGVDEYAVSRLLSQVFATGLSSQGKICALAKESASQKFDMKEEVMLTILTHLELGEVKYLSVLPQINATCTLNFHLSPSGLLAAKDIVIAAILKNAEIKHGQYVFDIPTVANSIGVSAVDISNMLQNLKAKGEITYDMKDPAYCYIVVNVPKDFCSLTAHLTKWLSEIESCKVQKIDVMFNAASFAVQGCKRINGCIDSQHTPCLHKKILEYFNGNGYTDVHKKLDQSSPFLRADIKVFLQSNSQAKFTPRAVARIMHGIASPAFPSMTWSKTHFWGRYSHIDFHAVIEAAKAELMNFVKTALT